MIHLKNLMFILMVIGSVVIAHPWQGVSKSKVGLDEQLLQEAQKGNYENVKKLLVLGGKVNVRGKYGETPLILAALHGHLKVVELLLSKGAEVNARNDVKETPLILAAQNKNAALVNLLLAHGADLNSKRFDGATPLMIASRQADLETVKLLLMAGAKPDEKDNSGRTALDYTAYFDMPMPGKASTAQPSRRMVLRGAPAGDEAEKRARLEEVRALLRQYGGGPGEPQGVLPK